MSRIDNLERIFDHFYTGKGWYEKTDKFRLDDKTVIYNHTPMGKLEENFIEELDEYHTFLIVTLQNFKSDRTWSSAKNALIKYAENHDIFVIYKWQIDIGFGLTTLTDYETIAFCTHNIVAFDSTHKLVSATKNYAELLGELPDKDEMIGIALDQSLYKASDILIWYKSVHEEYNELPLRLITLYCPEATQIYNAVDAGVYSLTYLIFHYDDKTKTQKVYEAFEDIYNGNYNVKYKKFIAGSFSDIKIKKFKEKYNL